MALLTRARGLVLAGVTAAAVALPLAPAASAVPLSGVSASGSVAATSSVAAATTTSVASADRVAKTSRGARFAARARKVLARGYSLRGVPYRYGGSTPRGFDCSGFTSYVYRKVGVKLPRRASLQARYAKKISRSKAKRGDLVFFRSGGRVYHVGIYAGKNKVLHAPRPGRRVGVERIWTRNVTFGRVL